MAANATGSLLYVTSTLIIITKYSRRQPSHHALCFPKVCPSAIPIFIPLNLPPHRLTVSFFVRYLDGNFNFNIIYMVVPAQAAAWVNWSIKKKHAVFDQNGILNY